MQDFPEKARKFLDAFYDAQYVKTNADKIEVLRHAFIKEEMMITVETEEEELKALEFYILENLSLLGWCYKAQKALDELYAKFGNNQNNEQKYQILKNELGGSDYFFSTDCLQTKVAILEHEWLGNQGLIEIVLC